MKRWLRSVGIRRIAPSRRNAGMLARLAALAMMDLLSCGGEHPPRAAELVEALSGRLPRLAIADEVVERVTVVGHFELAVAALRRTEQRSAHPGTGDRLARGHQRRPERRAG